MIKKSIRPSKNKLKFELLSKNIMGKKTKMLDSESPYGHSQTDRETSVTSVSELFELKKQDPTFYIINKCGEKCTIVFNLTWLGILISSQIYNLILWGDFIKRYSFFTNIGMVTTSIYCLVSSFFLAVGGNKLSVLFKWTSVLHSICISIETLVVILYWALIARTSIPNYPKICPSVAFCYVYTFISHLFVVIPVYAPLFFGWVEMEFFDFIYPMGFTTVYCFFVLYPITIAREPVYSIITFKDSKSFYYLFGIIIGTVLLYFSFYWVAKCRWSKFRKIRGEGL